ncbi:hypothetical protein PFISCL1PPCAC_17275 [Pristionchus fissidentatus]|uniref:Peroxisomal membrane protein PEX14 n=1 Tax=Pristionchus fissidentatus TaxID=1538716 RepID=A0AAV5W6A1_9BILA|nr:hypothetical protein PFISCL1PPCAC_17275 [Pristionchus fissidentatus]
MESDGLREEMVEAARKFMSTSKVRDSPYEEQKTFLLSKGVTEAEIEEARRLVLEKGGGGEGTVAYQGGGGGYGYPAGHYYPPPPQNRFVSTAQSVLVIGSVTYAGYKLLRSWVLPKFFDIPDPAADEARRLQEQVTELQNSVKFVMDSVAQTSRVLAEQQNEVSRALVNLHSRDADLSRIETGISTIRSLLLNQNQFAAPVIKPAALSIPDWQKALANKDKANEEDVRSVADSLLNGYATPPANMRDVEPEDEEETAIDD